MAEIWEAPAKVNFHLAVGPAGAGGMHPIDSVIQTIEWCDVLAIDEAGEDELVVAGDGVPDDRSNLIWKALDNMNAARPQLRFDLTKRIAAAAGLGGGSSDAAAALLAAGQVSGWQDDQVRMAAEMTGVDVPYFLTGGSAFMQGHGENVTPIESPFTGFAVAVAVPPFELATPAVYRRWDRLEGPRGHDFPSSGLPPALRREEYRNDLTPAALAERPELADWMQDLSRRWGTPVAMSGSGPSLFAFFPSVDEAMSAAAAAPAENRGTTGADLRPIGAARRPV